MNRTTPRQYTHPLMDLHPALRDYHANEHRIDTTDAGADTDAGRAVPTVRSGRRYRWLATGACVVCACVLGSSRLML